MPPGGFEYAIPSSEWAQIKALDRAVTWISFCENYAYINPNPAWNKILHKMIVIFTNKYITSIVSTVLIVPRS